MKKILSTVVLFATMTNLSFSNNIENSSSETLNKLNSSSKGGSRCVKQAQAVYDVCRGGDGGIDVGDEGAKQLATMVLVRCLVVVEGIRKIKPGQFVWTPVENTITPDTVSSPNGVN